MRRIIVSLVALTTVTAFAPAPLPRPQRTVQREEISLESFRGTWRVEGMMRTSKAGKLQPHGWTVTHVRVEGQTWTFMRGNAASTSHTLSIDATQRPAHIDFNRGGQGGGPRIGGRSPGQGIIRRKGDVVEIIYVFGGRDRATSFEQPPEGQYLLTLRRER